MTKEDFSKDKDKGSTDRSTCRTGCSSCGAPGNGGMQDRRPEMSESRGIRPNDVGLLYNQNNAGGVPYIVGPDQRRFFDLVHYVGHTIPFDRNYQLSLSMRDLFVKIRKPNTAIPPYTEEEMMVWMLNARSRRTVLNQLLRIAEYADMRLERSLNWSRGLAVALGLPEGADVARLLHEAATQFTEEYADWLTNLATTAKVVAENDYLFGVAVIQDDDEMYRHIYVDECRTPSFVAFFNPTIPKYSINGTIIEMTSYYDMGVLWDNESSASAIIAKLDALTTAVRVDMMTERSVARTALLIDLQDYMDTTHVNLGPVCLDGVERIVGPNGNEAAKVTKIRELPEKWRIRLRNAWGISTRIHLDTGGHSASSYPQTLSIDMSSGAVVNIYRENNGLTENHSYPIYEMAGFSISENIHEAGYFIVTGRHEDTVISGDGVNIRDITLNETRGTVLMDTGFVWSADNVLNSAARTANASLVFATRASGAEQVYYLATVFNSNQMNTPRVRGAADGSALTPSATMLQWFVDLEWVTARLTRVINAEEAQKLWLSVAMFPAVTCAGGSAAEIADKINKP